MSIKSSKVVVDICGYLNLIVKFNKRLSFFYSLKKKFKSLSWHFFGSFDPFRLIKSEIAVQPQIEGKRRRG